MAIESWEDKQLELIRPAWPDWDIWYVRYSGRRSGVWCARPKGAPAAIFHAEDPDGLADKLKRAVQAG
jgi:hypothetical protein